jgi:DNA-binding SARP family transcriptional activator
VTSDDPDEPVVSWRDEQGVQQWLSLSRAVDQLTIGRRDDSSVPLPWDGEVSRAHAQLEPVGRDWTIRDDGLSRNGTWVNGERLVGRRRLFDGDTIRVGRTLLAVTMHPRPDTLPTAGAAKPRGEPRPTNAGTTVRLCGPLVIERDGERLDGRLPGRQGRLVFAFLALHRSRPVRRDELVEAVWTKRLPKDPELGLKVILTRLRGGLGETTVGGRGAVTLDLGEDPFVDVEAAERWVDDAGRALAAGAPGRSFEAARQAEDVLSNPLLPEFDALPWVMEQQLALDGIRVAALETRVRAALMLGQSELAGAEAAARELVRCEPWRQSGYALLMQVLIASGNPAAARLVFDHLQTKLREELSMTPDDATLAIVAPLIRAPAG